MSIVTELNKNHSKFFQCSCSQELLLIEYDHNLNMAELVIYERQSSYNYKMSLWQRIRYCWYCLINGYAYHDQIVLNHNQLKELKTFLGSLDL